MRRYASALLLVLLCALFFLAPVRHANAATYIRWAAQVPATPQAGDSVRVWIDSDTVPGESVGVGYKINGGGYTEVLGNYNGTGYAYSGGVAHWAVDLPSQIKGINVSYQIFDVNQGGGRYNYTGDFLNHWSYTTGINFVAQVPLTPGPTDTVRVWFYDATVPGETGCLGYKVNGNNYTELCGTYDTSQVNNYPGANWRVDIPAQTGGVTVSYQLFTRNQSNSPYGYTNLLWSYTVTGGPASGLKHDSFDSHYRTPFGAVTEGTSVLLKLGTPPNAYQSTTLRVYTYDPASDTTSGPQDYPLTYMGPDYNDNGTVYALWGYNLVTPSKPAILYYKFYAVRNGGGTTDWYNDDYSDPHDNLHQGGTGVQAASESGSSFQISVYDPAYSTPAWLQNSTGVYQIFPDRFRNGDKTNDYCTAGNTTGCPTYYDGSAANDPVAHTTWNEAICDPHSTCPNYFSNQFFGGDLKGIQDELPYLQSLGIDTIYLTPIFQASSNHRYDTADYMHIDPALGGDAAFSNLIAAMNARGMHVILDGVFNHASSDSTYFNRYNHYPTVGACQSTASPFRNWWLFYDQSAGTSKCADSQNRPNSSTYDSWAGYDSLAAYDDASAGVREFIYGSTNHGQNGNDNVIKHWYDQGASGWRFDVADEISHNWWRDFRPNAKSYNPTGPLIGEVWYDASQYLLGDQLDGVMNYRFRKNILGFSRGVQWTDNDSNGSNVLVGLSPSQFDAAMRSIREDYPPQAQAAMLNLIDSHDTNRARYVLTLQGDSSTEWRDRLELTALFQFSYMGAPTVYYGDEVGLNSPSLYNGNNGPEDDPYNRAPYPWADETGNTSVYGPADNSVLSFYSTLAALRKQHPALRAFNENSFKTLVTDDANGIYSFARTDTGTDGNSGTLETGIVAMNQSAGNKSATIPVSAYFSDGTLLQDGITGATYTVSGGTVVVPLNARSGAILFLAPGNTLAARVTYVKVASASGNAVTVTWSATLESNALGYDLYAVAANGTKTRLNSHIIPAHSALGQPDSLYSAIVTLPTGANTVVLSDVEPGGKTRDHGPYALGTTSGTQPTFDASPAGGPQPASGGSHPQALKLVRTDAALAIGSDGIYHLDYAALAAQGIDLSSVAPARLALSSGGKDVPLYVKTARRDVFGPGDYIEFVAQAIDTLYSGNNIYVLTARPTTTARHLTVPPSVSLQPAPGAPPAMVTSRTLPGRSYYWIDAPANSNPYQWALMENDIPQLADQTIRFDLPRLYNTGMFGAQTVQVTLNLHGWGGYANAHPDHHAVADLGQAHGEVTFDGDNNATIMLNVPASAMQAQGNVLRLRAPGDLGVQYDTMLVQSISVTYPQTTALPPALTNVAGARPYTRPGELNASLTAQAGGRNLDYVIIAHPDFVAGVAPLAQQHRKQDKMHVAVVDVNAVYDSYSNGVADPAAIRSFIAALKKDRGLQYALLVGADNNDPRDYSQQGDVSYIPAFHVLDSFGMRSPSDSAFADVDGDGLPDVALGRLPVRTPTELATLVAKIGAFASGSTTKATFVSDPTDSAFASLANAAAYALPPTITAQQITWKPGAASPATDALLTQWKAGSRLVSYVGHSNADLWADDVVLSKKKLADLSGSPPAMVAVWGCWAADYDRPGGITGLSQALLNMAGGGAVGVVSSSTEVDDSQYGPLAAQFYASLYARGKAQPIGKVLMQAKRLALAAHPDWLDMGNGVMLFGDPASKL